ncbi:MAG: FAD-dependent oxidoreductase [Clostridia bacterium]|nr:FAD-dependent oxidoreductase [Clostridia bacterium]
MEVKCRDLPERYDVLVAGGGPAGVAAAVTAGRMGASVLLAEVSTALGGMATQGMVSAFAPFTDKEKVLYRSFPLEFLTRYKERAGIPAEKWDWVRIDPEEVKRLCDEMVSEAGVTVSFDTRVVGVEGEKGAVEAAILSNKAGLSRVRASVYVDATGDGDLAVAAGAPFEEGDGDGNCQPASLCFLITGVKKDRLTESVNSNPKDGLWARILATKRYPLLRKHFIPTWLGEDALLVNGGHLFGLRATDPASLSAAYALGRRVAREYLQALQDFQPEAFGGAVIAATAPRMGVRESRRILGDYVLTAEDYLLRRSFPDEVARNCYWLDCHTDGRKGGLQIPPEKRHYAPGESHGIPWRCLLPRGLKNVLTAGRCISMERAVLASVRVMPNCFATGEAAGVGAALAAARGGDVRAVSPGEVLNKIK